MVIRFNMEINLKRVRDFKPQVTNGILFLLKN